MEYFQLSQFLLFLSAEPTETGKSQRNWNYDVQLCHNVWGKESKEERESSSEAVSPLFASLVYWKDDEILITWCLGHQWSFSSKWTQYDIKQWSYKTLYENLIACRTHTPHSRMQTYKACMLILHILWVCCLCATTESSQCCGTILLSVAFVIPSTLITNLHWIAVI